MRRWDGLRLLLEDQFGTVLLGVSPVRGRLTSRAIEGRDLGVTGLAQAFTRANGRYLTGTGVAAARLADAEAAARFALLARDYFLLLEVLQTVLPGDTDIPSPDLAPHGLDEASVATALCASAAIDDVVVPDLGPNESGTLTVRAGVSFGGGPTAVHPSVAVEFFSDPGSSGAPPSGPSGSFTRTDAAGQASIPVTATSTGALRYMVCGVFHPQDFPGLFAGLTLAKPCRSSAGGVVVTPSQTTIAPGASRQFTVVVEDTDIQDVIWAVNGGGTITQTGLFTSNGTIGTFFVTATSVADPTAVGIAQVTVSGSPPPPPPPPGGLPCAGGCGFQGTFTACAITINECMVDPGSTDRFPSIDTDQQFPEPGGRLIHPLPAFGGCGTNIPFLISVQPSGAFTGVGQPALCVGQLFTVEGTVSEASLGYLTTSPNGTSTERFEGTRITVP